MFFEYYLLYFRSKMNYLSLCLFAAVLLGTAYAAPPSKYSSKYDHVNVDAILSNERVLTQYINCMLDKGPCTAEGREFRRKLLFYTY